MGLFALFGLIACLLGQTLFPRMYYHTYVERPSLADTIWSYYDWSVYHTASRGGGCVNIGLRG